MNRKVKLFLQVFSFIFVLIGISIGVIHFLAWIQDQVPGWMFFWLLVGVVCNGIISAIIASTESDKDNKSKSDDEKNL